jgi:zinc transport system permease protein
MNEAWDRALTWLCSLFPSWFMLSSALEVNVLLAVLLVSSVCGAVGALVVGNRMAFFSDALAHTAFAGVALGLLLGFVTGAEGSQFMLLVTLIMVLFGVCVGLAIAFVREKSGQASDTVIGVFFAGAIGLGAILLKIASHRRRLPPEDFLFGNPVTVTFEELLVLLILILLTAGVLVWKYNQMVFTSFSPSLAMSRQIPIRLCSYLLIVLLALIVNICLTIVGALLINALLVVPAATAANVCRNMRQQFRWSIFLCLLAGIGGDVLSWFLTMHGRIEVSAGGTIVVLSVVFYFLSLAVRPYLRGDAGAGLHNT